MIIVALLVSACATPRLDAFPAGGRVAVDIDPASRPIRLGIVNGNVGTGAGTGATAGAVIGVLGSAACGPLFVLCAGVFAAAGMGTGALVGTAVGAASGLPLEMEEAVIERARLREEAMRSGLVAAVRDQLRGRWTVVPDSAALRLHVYLDRVSLVVGKDQFASLAMRATVTFDRHGRDPRDRPEKRNYDYFGLPAHPAVWIEDDGKRIDEALRKAYSHIAEAIYLELAH
jgi:hypothetical protein